MAVDARTAAQVLENDPAPALPLHSLRRALARHRRGGEPSAGELLEVLRGRPDLFRVLDPWRGPWEPMVERGAASAEAFERWGILPPSPWVVARPDAAALPTEPEAVRRRPRYPRAKSRPPASPASRPRSAGSPPAPALPGARPAAGSPGGGHRRPRPDAEGRAAGAPAPPGGSPGLRRLRESLRWFALTVDADSVAAVARWTRMASQERDIRSAIREVAGRPPTGSPEEEEGGE